MKVKVGDYNLIFSEQIIGIKEEPIHITLNDSLDEGLTIIINFKRDKDIKDAQTKFTPLDEFALLVDFINFDGFNGGGNNELIKIGETEALNLFINYRAFDLKGASKTLLVNFYTLPK